MKSEELEFVIDNLSGFTECIQTCFNVYGGRVFYINHKNTPYIDITNILKDIFKFLWEEVYNEKYNSNSMCSLLDSDIFEKFLNKYNYEDNKITASLSETIIVPVYDGEQLFTYEDLTRTIEENITPFIKIAFSSIRKYIENKLHTLSEDSMEQFILKNII